jgi:hypothetical protein
MPRRVLHAASRLSVLHQPELPLGVSVLQQPVLPLDKGHGYSQQQLLSLDVSVLQQPVLPLEVSVLYSSLCCL